MMYSRYLMHYGGKPPKWKDVKWLVIGELILLACVISYACLAP